MPRTTPNGDPAMSKYNTPDIKADRLLRILFDELTRQILKILLKEPEGVTIPYILGTIYRCNSGGFDSRSKEWRKLYQRIYRRIQTLAKYGLVIIDSSKNSKYNIIKLNAKRARHVINLTIVRDVSVSQTRKQLSKKDPDAILNAKADDVTLPPIISSKLKALQILIKNKELDDRSRKELEALFKEYIWTVLNNKIVLIPKDEYRDLLPWVVLDYEVRFTSKRKAKQYKRQYRYIWRYTAKRYRWAVMITLTIDPSKVKSIWEARYLAQQEFNRFMTWLKKFLKQRARRYGNVGKIFVYVRFIEYQKNGRIHFHVIVFGTRWIMHENELAKRYWRLGFVDVQTLVNKRGKWVFKQKPKDYDERYRRYRRHKTGKETDGGSPLQASPDVYFYFSANYAGIEDISQLYEYDEDDLLNMALHWALDTRFFTFSKELQLPSRDLERLGGLYEFFVSGEEREIIDILEALGVYPGNVVGSIFKPPPQGVV